MGCRGVARASGAPTASHSKPPSPKPWAHLQGPEGVVSGLEWTQRPPPRPTVTDPERSLLDKVSHPFGASLFLPNITDDITSPGCMDLFLINLQDFNELNSKLLFYSRMKFHHIHNSYFISDICC